MKARWSGIRPERISDDTEQRVQLLERSAVGQGGKCRGRCCSFLISGDKSVGNSTTCSHSSYMEYFGWC